MGTWVAAKLLATVTNAAVNVSVQRVVGVPVFTSFGHVSRSERLLTF